MTEDQKKALEIIVQKYNSSLPEDSLPVSTDTYLAQRVNEVLDSYVKQTSVCPTCGKPL